MDNSAKKLLHPLKTYSAIGFDLDHCLVRYRLKDFLPIAYQTLARILVEEKSYPEEILNFGPKEISMMHNGVVIDLITGNILKLGENKLILRGYNGFDRLSQDQLEEVYGNPPKFEKFDPLALTTSEYFCCLTYFQVQIPALYAHLTEWTRKQKTEPLTKEDYKHIFDNIMHALTANYHHYTKEKYTPVQSYGYYFKTVIENIDKAVYKQEKMLQILQNFKSKGKILFLVSNSHYEPVEILMDYAFGKEWRTLFDFVIAKSAKPIFFTHHDTAFKELDHESQNKLGKEIHILDDNRIYLEGNSKTLETNIDNMSQNKHGRILYFGDQYITDAVAAEKNDRWDSVCLMEELDGIDLGDGYDHEFWGDFFAEETSYGKIPGLWWSYMKNKVAMLVPLADDEEILKFSEQE